MKQILVLGGYGGFGGRVSRLLGESGFAVIVAGRDLAKAQAFCTNHGDLPFRPAAVDRSAGFIDGVRNFRPWLVIDAAGPFQGSDYAVPQACIAGGCHYLDLADARDFVTGIVALDGAARAAGVAIVSGASSLPALSAAVVDAMVSGLDTVSAIDVALSASNRASGSRSVTMAILSYVGQPIRLWRCGRSTTGFGWQEIEKVRHVLSGHMPVIHRVALCDVPDLDLLPDRYPGRPATRFRAGTEIELQNVALWLLSWAVRFRLIASASRFAGLGLAVQRLLARIGGDRSAMTVRVWGTANAAPQRRRWTLIAEHGDGPWVPCFAAPLIAAKLERGEVAPGARAAAGALALDDFQPMLDRFALDSGQETEPASYLYRDIMREDFDGLPREVRRMHEVAGDLGAAGRVTVTRGRNPLARLAGWLFRFPPTMADAPVTIAMAGDESGEVWTRDFGGHSMRSHLGREGTMLVERFGLLSFAITLRREPGGLSMHHVGWRLGPVPMPRWLGPRGVATERATAGRFHFDVPIALPLIGMLIHYRGWLEPLNE